VRLEIGGGRHPRDVDQIRLDIRHLPGKVDVVADGKRLPFKSGIFDELYARHVIEHWGHRESLDVLREWLRVLKRGAVLEIHCPDLLKIMNLHRQGNLTDGQLAYYLYGGQEYPENTHRTGFTQSRLIKCVSRCGGSFISRQSEAEDQFEMKMLFRK
jgi:predicted SAM-dependent methyltransferase